MLEWAQFTMSVWHVNKLLKTLTNMSSNYEPSKDRDYYVVTLLKLPMTPQSPSSETLSPTSGARDNYAVQ